MRRLRGAKRNVVDELLKVEVKKFAYAGSKSDNVLYEKYETLFLADDFKGIAGEMTLRIFEPRDVSEVTGLKDIDAFMPKFMSVAPFMKHRGFSQEREYRILFSCCNRPPIRYPVPQVARRAGQRVTAVS